MGAVKKLVTGGGEHCGFVVYEIASRAADELHHHEHYYQISIPLIGLTQMQHDRQRRTIDRNQRMVISPNDPHRHFAFEEEVRMLLFFIQQDYLQRVWEDQVKGATLNQIEFAPWGSGSSDGFKNFAKRIMRESLNSSISPNQMQEMEWEVTTLLLSSQEGSHSKLWKKQSYLLRSQALQRAIEWIQDDLAADLSLDRLAEESGVNKFHLIRLFKEQIGSTPSRFISQLRLERAQELLTKSLMDITEIAFEVGFGSLSAFERAFKTKYGINPNAFRKQRK